MNPKTTLLLLLVVVALGGAVWWQTRREETAAHDLVQPLFVGVDPARVVALRVDHIERGVQVKLERDEAGHWYLTDPVAYAADEAVVKLLLDAVSRNQMLVLPPEERSLAEPGFQPPRAHLEVTELLADGRRRQLLVELGPKDIDGQHVYVRRDGEIYKTTLNLDNTLTRNEPDYRSKRLLVFDPRLARSVQRSGSAAVEGGTISLDLEAHKSGIEWRMTEPWVVAADDRVLDNYLFALANLRLLRFVSEGQHPLEDFGLHQPDLRVEVGSADGSSQALILARPSEGGPWFAKREGLGQVWQIEDDVPARISLPASSMLQLELLSFVRAQVERVELVGPQAELRLDRSPAGRWTVSERTDGTWGLALPADTERADALLADIENARVTRYLLELDPEEVFEGVTRSIAVTQQGQAFRIRIGGRYRSEEGSEALQAWRDGDRVVALVPTPLGELFERTRRDLQSLAVFELDEVRLATIELESEDVEREFVRPPQRSVWSYPDMDAEALELRPVLDKLFFLRAAEHLDDPAATLEPLQRPIEVRIADRGGTVHAATVGLGSDGRVYLEHLGTRSLAEAQDLHGQLEEILARKAQGQDG